MSRLLKILHLSDLHLSTPVSHDQSVLLSALKADLEALSYSSHKPDLLIVSGDLVDKADDKAAFDEALTLLIEIQKISGVDEEHTIICAGNHDIKRSHVEANLDSLKEFRKRASTCKGMNELVSDPSFVQYAEGLLGHYYPLEQAFATANILRRDIFSSTMFFSNFDTWIVTLNSSVLCAGGLKSIDGDETRLSIAEKTIVEALKPIPAEAKVIFVVHHPTNSLCEEGRIIFERIVGTKGFLLLSGHLHYVKPLDVNSIGGHALFAQSGALYNRRDPSRDYWNGYSTICICLENRLSRISYRRWFESRREFGKAEDLKSDGEFYSSDEARIFWQSTNPTFDVLSLERWRSTSMTQSAERVLQEALYGSNQDGRFVEPEFEREKVFNAESDSRIGSKLEIMSLNQVLEIPGNIVISAKSETGKSTLLAYIAYTVALEPYSTEKKNIPVIISFASIRNYVPSITNAIRAKLKDLPRDLNAEDMITSGMLTIMIDEVDFANRPKRECIVAFVQKFPLCRYIFTSSTPFIDVAALKPEIVRDVPFSKVTLRSLRRGQLLALVEGHGLTDPLAADQMVERVLRDASALNVPLTAVTGTFLIRIFREEPDSKVINQAALIERYIDICLEKYAPRDLLPGTFDFKNKVDLLCHITERLIRNGIYSIDENEFTAWCIEYLKNYGLKFSAPNLVDYFVQSRIMHREDGKIRFRLKVFASFFAATRMIDNDEFREFIFDSERYLSFSSEIGFYCALNRRDLDKLEKVWTEFERLTNQLYQDSDPNQLFLNTKLPERKATEQELSQIHSALTSSQIDEDRKALQADNEVVDDNQEQGFEILSIESPGERWTAHLILMSGMIKHMELISNDQKVEFVKRALDGWTRFSVTSLSVIPELAKNRRVVFNGVTYRSTLSDEVPVGEFARRLILYMPIAVARLATAFLGTEKLQSQLETGIGKSEEPLGRQFFRIAILADLGVDNFVNSAEKAQEAFRSNDFVNHVFGRKLYEVAVRYRLSKDKLSRVTAIVGGVFGRLYNYKKEGLARGALVTGIEQQRLRIELEEKASTKPSRG